MKKEYKSNNYNNNYNNQSTTTTLSSCVSQPPFEYWEQFVEIKKKYMNPKITRPPFPHVTLLAPFLFYKDFDEAQKSLTKVLSDFKPFEVEIKEFKIFKNKNNSTLYLNPETNPSGSYEKLFNILKKEYPDSVKGEFSPHIGVGFFTDYNEAVELQKKYQKDWKPIKFLCKEIYFLKRKGESPFEVRKVIPLGNDDSKPYFKEIKE